MTPSEFLTVCRDYIADSEHWTQSVLARDKFNMVASTHEETACKFCSLGIMSKYKPEPDLYFVARRHLESAMEGPIHIYNDRHTHAQVLAAWDLAIKCARAEEE